MIEQSRRGFIGSLIAFTAAAPAIVRATSLMPVKSLPTNTTVTGTWIGYDGKWLEDGTNISTYGGINREANFNWVTYSKDVREAFLPRLHVQVYDQWPQIDFMADA